MQDKACYTSYWAPQIHFAGSRDNSLLYFNFTKSQNSCLFKQYPSSFSVNVDSRIDAPFPWCMSFNFSFSSDKEHSITLKLLYILSKFLKFNIYLQHLYFFLVFNWSFINDAVAALELPYLFLAKIKKKSQRKITIPILPHFTGNGRSFLSISL